MKKLYETYFYIPKNGKIREPVMLVRIALTAILMIGCLAAMSMSAYAYFSGSITSASNTIRSAYFDVSITVTPVTTEYNGQQVMLNSKVTNYENGTYKLSQGIYTIQIGKKEGSTAKTGFCVITIGKEKYVSQQIGIDVNAKGGKTELVQFTLAVVEEAEVCFQSHWGTSAHYPEYNGKDVVCNENYTIIGNEEDAIAKILSATETSGTEGVEEADLTAGEEQPTENGDPATPETTGTEAGETGEVPGDTTDSADSVQMDPATEVEADTNPAGAPPVEESLDTDVSDLVNGSDGTAETTETGEESPELDPPTGEAPMEEDTTEETSLTE